MVPSLTSSAAVSAEPRKLLQHHGCSSLWMFSGILFSGTISCASFIDDSVCTTGHMTHALVLLCPDLTGWCSLRPFCSLGWHIVNGCARSDGAPTKSTCISSVLGRAQSVEGQLVIMPFVVDEGQLPHVRVLAWCFSGSPVVCQPWHSQHAVCLLRWTAFTELLGRSASNASTCGPEGVAKARQRNNAGAL